MMSAKVASSSVDLNALTRCVGRRSMKPTVSVSRISPPRGKRKPPRGRVERSEQLILRENARVGQPVEQRRLPRVGIADDGGRRDAGARALAAVDGARLFDVLQLGVQRADALADAAAVQLELALAGPARADGTAGAALPGQRLPLAGQTRRAVTQAGRFRPAVSPRR